MYPWLWSWSSWIHWTFSVCSDNEESGVGGGGTGEKQNLWLKFLSASVCDKNLKEVELFHLKKKTVK